MITVFIDTAAIVDRSSFHHTFQNALGFPDFYGANMDAWIDCMSSLDQPESELSRVTVKPGQVLALELSDSLELAVRCPDIWQDLMECIVFVNQRYFDRQAATAVVLHLR